MLCHKSKLPTLKIPCAGYVLIVGFESIGLRIAAMQGTVDISQYSANGLRLFGKYFRALWS